MFKREIHTQYTPKKYLSGIYVVDSSLNNDRKTRFNLFVVDLTQKKGFDPFGTFYINPQVLDQDHISFYKTYAGNRFSLTNFGKQQNHPIEEKPLVGHYQICNTAINDKLLFINSQNPIGILNLPAIDVIGQIYLHPEFKKCNIITPKRISI